MLVSRMVSLSVGRKAALMASTQAAKRVVWSDDQRVAAMDKKRVDQTVVQKGSTCAMAATWAWLRVDSLAGWMAGELGEWKDCELVCRLARSMAVQMAGWLGPAPLLGGNRPSQRQRRRL